jgi:hypothetical protein
MAAIGRKAVPFALLFAAWFALPAHAVADRAADVLRVVNHVATALTDDNAADAMTSFSKSYKDYSKLENYFDGLTSRALLVNEVTVTDEQDSDTETNLVVHWTMDLTDKADASDTEDRFGDLKIRVVQEDGKWKIVDVSPISFFDPAHKPANQRKR